MKNILMAVGVLGLVLAMTSAQGQTNMVKCKSMLDGETIQYFPGTMCPTGWHPV